MTVLHVYTRSILTIIKCTYITGTLELICSEETVAATLTLGTKIDISDIAINDDRIIMGDLSPLKQHLTENAWVLVQQEGIRDVSLYCTYLHVL